MYEHIHCSFLPSRYLLCWLAFLNGWAILFLLSIDAPADYLLTLTLLKIFLIVGLFVWTFRCIKRDFYLTTNNSIHACIYNKNTWRLVMGDGSIVDVLLHSDSVVWHELMVLGFKPINGASTRFVVIFPDSCALDLQRKLRAQLRLRVKVDNSQSFFWKIKIGNVGN